jgi:hypothetical protein
LYAGCWAKCGYDRRAWSVVLGAAAALIPVVNVKLKHFRIIHNIEVAMMP